MRGAAGGRNVAAMISELEQMKHGARAVWAAGDFPKIARRELWPVGERVVRRAAIRPGEDVLDVACGTGNAALRAAAAGARVTGVDLTPELLDEARRLAAEDDLDVEWIEGDAEALPVADDSADVVLSTFGCMFAPRHQVVADEIVRVLRPGGRFVITAWDPEGAIGQFFRTIGAFMPPPSPLAQPPVLWGSEPHVRELFAGAGVELTFDREDLPPTRFATSDEAVADAVENFGPMMMAKQMAEASGRWDELRSAIIAHHDAQQRPVYLVTSGQL